MLLDYRNVKGFKHLETQCLSHFWVTLFETLKFFYIDMIISPVFVSIVCNVPLVHVQSLYNWLNQKWNTICYFFIIILKKCVLHI